jgi:RNA polymerase-associated protein RTF1
MVRRSGSGLSSLVLTGSSLRSVSHPHLILGPSTLTFLQAEWNRYKQTCLSEGVAIPKKPALINKIDDINKLVNRKWTELELMQKLERQNGLYIKYSGIERERLEKQIADAIARGHDEKAAKLQEELDKVEVPRLAFKTSLTSAKKKQDKGPTQQDLLAKLNAENRRRTAETVRKAQLKELQRSREIEMKISRGEHVEEDHSRRVRTRAKFVHDKNEYDQIRKQKEKDRDGAKASGTSTPASGTPSMKPQVLPHIAKLQEQQRQATKGGIPVIHKPLMDDDIIGALDLDIDIEI